MRDFVGELNNFLKTIDIPKPTIAAPKEELRIGPLYNIHKRSLPIGMDKVVEIGLTADESIKALSGRYKAIEKGEILVYYDRIKQDATDEQMSVYFNDAIIIV